MAPIENPGREPILTRIKEALKTPAKIHASPEPVNSSRPPIFAPIPDALERFRASRGQQYGIDRDGGRARPALRSNPCWLLCPRARYSHRTRGSCASCRIPCGIAQLCAGHATAVRMRIRRRRLLWRKCWWRRRGR